MPAWANNEEINPMSNEAVINLTAAQIKDFDEIGADKIAIENTLKVALQFHSNRANEISKREQALWKELAEIHGFDLNVAGGYKLDYSGPAVRVVRNIEKARNQ